MAAQGLYLEEQRKTPFTFPHALIPSPSCIPGSASTRIIHCTYHLVIFSIKNFFLISNSLDTCRLPFILLTTITASTAVSRMCQVGP